MAENTSTLSIKQGDAYSLRVRLDLNREPVTEEELPLLHCVEFMLGDGIRKTWPEDGGFESGAFLMPLTQEETFALEDGEKMEFDVRVHFANGDVVGMKKKLTIKIVDAISEVRL